MPTWRKSATDVKERDRALNNRAAVLLFGLSVAACSGHADTGGPATGGATGAAGTESSGGPGMAGNPNGGAAPEVLVDAFITQIRTGAATACLLAPLPLAPDGGPNCKVFSTASAGSCSCTAEGRAPVSDAVAKAIVDSLASIGSCDYIGAPACSSFCVCEVKEAAGSSKQDCLNNETPATASSGWCYVAPAAGIGSAPAVAQCPVSAKQKLRFLGSAQPAADEIFSAACSGEATTELHAAQATPGSLGSVCTSSSEYDPSFGGFTLSDVSVDIGSMQCQSGICLQNHFQGRVSCPYGQGCVAPGSKAPVTGFVPEQFVARPPTLASTCTCRCAGGGSGPFCSCPTGMQCAPLFAELGLSSEGDYAGSYCIPEGSEFNATKLPTTRCDLASMNCGAPNP
jgi:hypothetical protein